MVWMAMVSGAGGAGPSEVAAGCGLRVRGFAGLWHGFCASRLGDMATKLQLATFLQEIRYYTAVMDRQGRPPVWAEAMGTWAWPSEWPVGIQRRRLQVEFQSGYDAQLQVSVRVVRVSRVGSDSRERSRNRS